MKFLQIVDGMILLSFVPLSAPAQEIGYMDLTDNIFRESSRQTRTSGGGCGGSSHTTQASQSEVTATVVSLDRVRYRIGEEATFEIKVLNSGKEAIIVPWTPHLGDLEPTDTRSSYKYRGGVILLLFKDPEGFEFSISETLYGSPNVPGSLRGRKRVTCASRTGGRKSLGTLGSSQQVSAGSIGKIEARTPQRMEAVTVSGASHCPAEDLTTSMSRWSSVSR